MAVAVQDTWSVRHVMSITSGVESNKEPPRLYKTFIDDVQTPVSLLELFARIGKEER